MEGDTESDPCNTGGVVRTWNQAAKNEYYVQPLCLEVNYKLTMALSTNVIFKLRCMRASNQILIQSVFWYNVW